MNKTSLFLLTLVFVTILAFGLFVYVNLKKEQQSEIKPEYQSEKRPQVPQSALPPAASPHPIDISGWNVYQQDVSVYPDMPKFKVLHPYEWTARPIDLGVPEAGYYFFGWVVFSLKNSTLSFGESIPQNFFLDVVNRTELSSMQRLLYWVNVICENTITSSPTFSCPQPYKVTAFTNSYGVSGIKIERNLSISYWDEGTGEERKHEQRSDFVIGYEFPYSLSKKYAGVIFSTFHPDALDIMLSVADTFQYGK